MAGMKVTKMQPFFQESMTNASAGRVKASNDSFANAIDGALGRTDIEKSGVKTDENTGLSPKTSKTVVETDARAKVNSSNTGNDAGTEEANKIKNESTNDAHEGTGADSKIIDDEISENVTKIRESIKEELSVDDEELESMMAEMGFVANDLLNVNNVRDLMINLSGQEDAIALLTNETLLSSINNVSEIVENSLTSLMDEFGLTEQDLMNFEPTELNANTGDDIFTENLQVDFENVLSDAELDIQGANPEINANDIANKAATNSFLDGVDVNSKALNELDDGNMYPAEALKNSESAENEPVAIENEATTGQMTPKDLSTLKEAVLNDSKVRTDENNSSSNELNEKTVDVSNKTDDNVLVRSFGKKNTDNDNSKQEDSGSSPQGNLFGAINELKIAARENVANTSASYTTSYVDAENIMEQIAEHVKVNVTEDTANMEIQLHPASLGTVNISIESSGGTITAKLTVQNESVKAALQTQMVQLLDTFAEQGQKVENIEVAVANYDLDRNLNQNADANSHDRNERENSEIRIASRRRLNLNLIDETDMEDLSEEEQLAVEMMELNGTSVDYMA